MYKTKVNNRTIFTKPIIRHFLNQRFIKKKNENKMISKININWSKKLIKWILGNTAM